MKPPTRALRPMIPNNACPLYYRGCWPGLAVLPLKVRSKTMVLITIPCSLLTELYGPRPSSLTRRCCVSFRAQYSPLRTGKVDRVSVPVWLIILSDQLSVLGLVGLPATTVERGLILATGPKIPPFPTALWCISSFCFRGYSNLRVITHVLLTRAALTPEGAFALDLHVLGTQRSF